MDGNRGLYGSSATQYGPREMPDTENGFLSAQVREATGMVAAQLDCDPGEALGRLQIAADASERTLDQMAQTVIDRSVRFS